VSKKKNKRAEIVTLLAAHFLQTGLSDSGLRRLAEVAGTSDRMLLYYFENKDELVATVLRLIADGLTDALNELFGQLPKSPDHVLRTLWAAAKSDIFKPHLRLWLDLSTRAGRGDAMLLSLALQISAGWIEWMASLLAVPEAEKKATASLILAAVDGQLVLFPAEIACGDAAIQVLLSLFESKAVNA
jgi:AcrR family transcriptional regulator